MMIGIFGNTNNYPYLLATGFQKLGVSVKLVVNRPEMLHRPESRVRHFSTEYPNWIYDCSHIAEDDFVCESARIGEALNFVSHGCNAILLNHIGPSLRHHFDVPTAAFLTGSDLTYYGDPRSSDYRSQDWDQNFKNSPGGRLAKTNWLKFVGRQRNGILEANAVSYPPRGLIADGDALLDLIGVRDEQRFFLYFGDTLSLKSARGSVRRSKMVILNGSRISSQQALPGGFSNIDNKCTDILLKGFAVFIKQGGNAELRLINKGPHVKEVQQLVAQLCIQDYVTWLDEMRLDKFYDQIRNADVVCDQFGLSFPGMVALDAMALGRPVLANFRMDVLGAQFPERPPVCHATTPDEVSAHLEALALSPHKRQELGHAAREFAEKHLSPEANARKCIERLGLSV